MKDDRLYLIHISECIERIGSYTTGKDKQQFVDSTLLQDAVIRNLQTMAESTQRVSDKAKEQANEVDWFRIAGFRNVLVHDYLGIDVERVWNILFSASSVLSVVFYSFGRGQRQRCVNP